MQPDGTLRWVILALIMAGFLFYSIGLLYGLSVFTQQALSRLLIGATPLLALVLWWSPLRELWRSRNHPERVDSLNSITADYFGAVMLIEAGVFGLIICLGLIPMAIEQGHPELILLAVGVIVVIAVTAAAGSSTLKARLMPALPDTAKAKRKRGK